MNNLHLQFLLSAEQHALGAMFFTDMNDELLAFIYPTETTRTFHTFFCPPMKIVALSGDGTIVFDQVVTKWKFVKLPACRVVIECGPQADYSPHIQTILSISTDLPQLGAIDPSVQMDSLLFALLSEAVADMRRIRDTHRGQIKPEIQRRKFEVWERGQIVSSAGFLLDFCDTWSIPSNAVRLSHSILQAEEPYLDELVAASVAGIPWQHEFPNACMRCGKPGSWHPILSPGLRTAVEITWRYQRPENCIPVCHHCTETLGLLQNKKIQIDLVWGLWGPRFDALWRWHQARKNQHLPKWDMVAYPLWPREFGGETWEGGSGALKDARPRPPYRVKRSKEQMKILRQALFSKPTRSRQTGETHLRKLLNFRLELSQGETP
ncbi:MAG: hypothetical protein HZB50_03625 [Chloroflexi bacterium]|nr:hypothetical protein [Chloroflexota bacterium]